MEASRVSKEILVNSHFGRYGVNFCDNGIEDINENPVDKAVYIIDKNIASLYSQKLANILMNEKVLIIEATEENKSIDKFSNYVDHLVDLKLRRGQTLVAIGGGIIQDITCFLSTTFMRGVPWIFFPTSLVAQADSCIGSKSSINSGNLKNILGTFRPPVKVVIDVNFIDTLEKTEIFSGIGEMIKVHAINSPKSFDKLSLSYKNIISDKLVLEKFIYESLLMKKKIIELDEFDDGPRNVMNYGHSFGHALESVTNYAIPHGIAVTMGMDLANFTAVELGISNKEEFDRMHGLLMANSLHYHNLSINLDQLMTALSKDKKNSVNTLKLILPDSSGKIFIDSYANNNKLKSSIHKYFTLYGNETNS